MLLTPSLMILSTPSLRLSTATVCVARISTASVVAKAGIIPSTPFNSLALIIGHLLLNFPTVAIRLPLRLSLRLVNSFAKALSNKTIVARKGRVHDKRLERSLSAMFSLQQYRKCFTMRITASLQRQTGYLGFLSQVMRRDPDKESDRFLEARL